MYVKSFIKGFLIGALVLFIANFCFDFLGSCTFNGAKEYYNNRFGDSTVVADTVSENDINITIAKELQKIYGSDSLNITSISSSSINYEYYVSGVKGVKTLEDKNQRVKNVDFTNGSLQYRIIVIYNNTDGVIVKMENDTKPIKVNVAQPIIQNVITPVQNVPQRDTTINDNNKNIGVPTSDYNNNSDV
jgi:hypothetical protein